MTAVNDTSLGEEDLLLNEGIVYRTFVGVVNVMHLTEVGVQLCGTIELLLRCTAGNLASCRPATAMNFGHILRESDRRVEYKVVLAAVLARLGLPEMEAGSMMP